LATANGRALAYKVRLDEARGGDIAFNHVHAGTGLPIMLLGMSFLSCMKIQSDGEKMVLGGKL
jgi:predicted aspartyl protease